MIRAILWKEWREQRSIALAILVFGVIALVVTAEFADAKRGGAAWVEAGPRELMAVSLAYLAGAVCGGMLLADEKEIGTIEFLDSLPCSRRSLWFGKIAFGLLLTIGQGLMLAVFAYIVGCIDERVGITAFGTVVVLVGLLSFAWGACGGALAKSTLGAVFLGSLASTVAGIALSIPFLILFGPRAFGKQSGPVILGYFATWLVVGLLASAAVFTAMDRDRGTRGWGSAKLAGRRVTRGPGLRALFWLSGRQAVYLALGAFGASAVLGAVMLAPDVNPVFIWPGATLVLGVLAGVTALGEEQTRGIARFWAERRVPLGRLWLVKLSFHFALAIVAGFLVFLPMYAVAPHLPFRSRLLVALRPELGTFLWLGLVYGFVFGHLSGMLFRKTVVAGLVGTISAVTVVGLLLPGAIGGGTKTWQIWAPALVLLLTARLIVSPWATERVLSRGPVLRAVGGLALASIILAAGLMYRVYEIPLAPDRLAENGFEQTLPTFEANVARRDARAAAAQFRKASQEAKSLYPAERVPPRVVDGVPQPLPLDSLDPLDRAGRLGWVLDVPLLGLWLDKVFADDWPRLLTPLLDKPIGVFDDPREVDYFQTMEAARDLQDMCAAIRVRGRQRQVAGDPDTYPQLLVGALAAVRTARSRSGEFTTVLAMNCETILLAGLSEWLAHLKGRPDLLQLLLPELVRHEREMPVGKEDTFWAEQIILRNTMDRLATWLPRELDSTDSANAAKSDGEAELVSFAWNVPWERARRERLLRLQSNADRPIDVRWLSALHSPKQWLSGRLDRLGQMDQRSQVPRRFALLRVALRLYEVEHGTPATDLAQLVPTYVPAIPLDPYSGRALRYRLSEGEYLQPSNVFHGSMPGPIELLPFAVVSSLAHPVAGLNGVWVMGNLSSASFTRSDTPVVAFGVPIGSIMPATPVIVWVRRGNGILWSVGADGNDGGGKHPAAPRLNSKGEEDWIVIVPGVR